MTESIAILAEDLRKKVNDLEEWLKKDHRIVAAYTQDNVTLSFKRKGNNWKLFVEEPGQDIKLLEEASLKLKIYVPSMIPGLLQAMEKEQQDLILKMKEAIIQYGSLMSNE